MTSHPDLRPSASSDRLPPAGALMAIFLCMLFGANPVAVKATLAGVGVFTTAGLRFGIAATLLVVYAGLAGKSLRVSSRQLLQLWLLSGIFFVQISLFYFGQSLTTASHGALIANVLPFVVMVLAHFLLPDDRISARKIGGLILGFSGVVLLFVDALQLTAEAWRGDCLLVLAVVVWGSNAIYVKRIIDGFSPLQITVYPMILGLPCYLGAGILFDGEMVHSLSTSVLTGIFYQSVVTAGFGFVMWNSLIQRYGATALHAFVFLMPISGVTLSGLLLGETISANLIGSILLVSAGLIIINRNHSRTG